jgi:hypothetical protein
VDVKKAEKKGVPSKTEKKIVSSSVKDPLSAMLDPLSASLEGSDPLSQMAISSQSGHKWQPKLKFGGKTTMHNNKTNNLNSVAFPL